MRFVNNFQVEECSIPEGMTLEEWRRSRSRQERRSFRDRARRRSRHESGPDAPRSADQR